MAELVQLIAVCKQNVSYYKTVNDPLQFPLLYLHLAVCYHRQFYSCLLSDLAFEWQRGWRNTRAKRLCMRKVSIFKLAAANANFTTRMPVFELKSNFISIQNFKTGNVKPPGMRWSKDFSKVRRDRARKPLI